jgi:hypothetical protein
MRTLRGENPSLHMRSATDPGQLRVIEHALPTDDAVPHARETIERLQQTAGTEPQSRAEFIDIAMLRLHVRSSHSQGRDGTRLA